METRYTFCRICESLCGLEVTVDNNRVVSIRPDRDNVATTGSSCVKGTRQHMIYDSPDRLRHPLKRRGDSYVQVSWDDALSDIGRRCRKIIADHGPDSVAMYLGTAAGFSMLHPLFAQGFLTGIGSRSMYAPHTQDCANKFAVARLMYGFPYIQAFPDVDRTDFLLIAGGNPAISRFSFLHLPNAIKRFKAVIGRGGRVVFVDPRRTESARAVGEHVFIRPGSDVFFYLSFLCELDAIGGIDRVRAEKFMKGLDEVLGLARAWPPERTEPVTGISAGVLRGLVASYSKAKSAALYCSTGVNMGGAGSMAFWLQEVINAASGNLDRFGGTLVGRGAVDFPALGKKLGFLLRTDTSRIGSFPSVSDCFAGGVLADEILTPGKGQVRALFCTGGNPLNTMANPERLKKAFSSLDLMVSVDIFLNETASVADYVLPATTFFEMPDIHFIFPLLCGLQMVPYAQATDRVVDPDGEQRNPAHVYADLARACRVDLFGSRVAGALFRLSRFLEKKGRPLRALTLTPERLFSFILRACGLGGFRSLLKHPHRVLRAPHAENDFLGKRVLTGDGLVDLAPVPLMRDAERLESIFESQMKSSGRLKLITRRAVRTHNSWMHNVPEFVSGHRKTNYLYVNPSDAAARGLAEGDFADVTSAAGTVRLPVSLLEDLMPGVVALPHGWGHQPALGLSVAARTEGVNVNLLAPDGPGNLEGESGMARLTGIDVEVEKSPGLHDPSSWSGIPRERPM